MLKLACESERGVAPSRFGFQPNWGHNSVENRIYIGGGQYLFQWPVVKRKWFMASLLTIDCRTTYTLRFEKATFAPSTTQLTRAGLIRFPTHVKTQD